MNKNFWVSFRDLFWPILEKPSADRKPNIIDYNIFFREQNLEEIEISLQFAIKEMEAENERFKISETKSIVFIGALSLVVTIIINVFKEYILAYQNKHSMEVDLFIFLTFIVFLYLIRTIQFSIKALKRLAVMRLDYGDYCQNRNNNVILKKQILIRLVECNINNRKEINYKVSMMTMAQEYFNRALYVLLLYLPLAFVIMFPSCFGYILNAFKILNSQLLKPCSLALHWILDLFSAIIFCIAIKYSK